MRGATARRIQIWQRTKADSATVDPVCIHTLQCRGRLHGDRKDSDRWGLDGEILSIILGDAESS
jgi:hypothetical protein